MIEPISKFHHLCIERHRFPVNSAPTTPRSATIDDELGKLREDYRLCPEKRWHIEKRAQVLKSALMKHPEWHKGLDGEAVGEHTQHLSEPDFETAVVTSLM